MEPTYESATQNLGSSSTVVDRTSVLKQASLMQPLDTAITPTEDTTPNSVKPAKTEENTPEDPRKTDDLSMEPTAETTTQDLESSSPVTCHTSTWYLAFSMWLIFGLVACFNELRIDNNKIDRTFGT
ncbi:hypothetical protein CRM22_007327 [Opisthorchis felineus]|uniref:Uncharacterized protein n=1 Tax=Opisthorchis felineus TaxID=147828 RepID=A0A4S2LP94_OPIFE|nr:hypothetical protein CRM22_007327 [Opisthorchis felineus]